MAKTIAVTEQPSTGLQQLKTQPARLGEFLKDVRSEMRKVISPVARRGSVDHDRRPRHGLHLRRVLLAGGQHHRPGDRGSAAPSDPALNRDFGSSAAVERSRRCAKKAQPWRQKSRIRKSRTPRRQRRGRAHGAACPAGQRKLQVVHHPRLLRLRAQGARVAREPHHGLRPAEPHRPHHDPDRAGHRAAQRQEVHHRARLPARLRSGRDGTRQRPLARHQEHAARHRLPWHRRQSGRALRAGGQLHPLPLRRRRRTSLR